MTSCTAMQSVRPISAKTDHSVSQWGGASWPAPLALAHLWPAAIGHRVAAADGARFRVRVDARSTLGRTDGLPPPTLARTGARNRPVWDSAYPATCSGVPSTTTRPPREPHSGPRSTIQSADLTTSRLCSMTMTVLPLSTRPCRTPSNLLMSSKCNPVVGSSRT